MPNGDSKPSGFTVTDRRAMSDQPSPATAAADQPAPAPQDDPSGSAGLPPVDFHTFVLSLGSSALLHLGEIENPNDGASQKDLPLAKHTIDILAMLEEKTKGNLSTAEERLMESLLYDLRLRYVEATKSETKSSQPK